ncbi:unnamed protein product, partial [Protopolystoma xenopodis]
IAHHILAVRLTSQLLPTSHDSDQTTTSLFPPNDIARASTCTPSKSNFALPQNGPCGFEPSILSEIHFSLGFHRDDPIWPHLETTTRRINTEGCYTPSTQRSNCPIKNGLLENGKDLSPDMNLNLAQAHLDAHLAVGQPLPNCLHCLPGCPENRPLELVNPPPAHYWFPHRVWKVRLIGESVDDCGGGFSECIAEMCDELQQPHLTGLPILVPAGQVAGIGPL